MSLYDYRSYTSYWYNYYTPPLTPHDNICYIYWYLTRHDGQMVTRTAFSCQVRCGKDL